jgi:hypothetical protein
MAIVASGYLFADDLAYHVDVFQGDTPSGLLSRYAPGTRVKSAAVLDIDVPGQTCPLELAADEPVVVVGASPRTSVFVYGESGSAVEPEALQEGGLVSTQSPSKAAAPAPPAEPEPEPEPTASKSAPPSTLPPPPPLADVPAPAPAPEEQESDATRAEEETPKAVDTDKPFAKTRRMRKPKAARGTRRAPKVLKIELA